MQSPATDPGLELRQVKAQPKGRCRTNSRRGQTDPTADPTRRSNPFVGRWKVLQGGQPTPHRLDQRHLRPDRIPEIDHRAHARNADGRGLCRARQHVRRLSRHRPGSRAAFRLRGHLADHRGIAASRRRPDAPHQVADRHRRARRRCDRAAILDRARSAPGRTPTRCSACGRTCRPRRWAAPISPSAAPASATG